MRGIDNRKLIWILGGLLLVITAAFGWSLTRGYDEKKDEVAAEAVVKEEKTDQTACASSGTYARLKEVAFEEAMRLRGGGDTANLDTLAASSVVRMENPVVMSRDEDLNVTVCSGRFILELPPGAETAFGGQRRLAADIEYSAQAAVDGSGLVYQVRGAEPIVTKLAAFQLRGQQPALPAETQLAEAPPASPPPPPAPETEDAADEPEAAPAPRPAPPPPPPAARPPAAEPDGEPVRASARANPSFNCRYARTRGERMVCGSPGLAARDRAMSSLFYSALADADGRTRAALRRTRDRFLSYRDRCGSEACVAEAYEGRMQEIRDIMEDAQ